MSERRIAELKVRLAREVQFNREKQATITRLEKKCKELELELRWALNDGVPDRRKNL